ncbi:nickel-responsive transcriptional regulator NikR [Telmatospirillum siberiense]|uniref:Putative nickel-responsive regulator n=1 Tax=Telmatospirillum siberiense TaxID=382514 RepID=A0A2N3PUZ3_9PROT|nr:nickel-responsive transcriptional regulator NikR [Telmatospirillum siberiense]PKU24208.1 nickel-responsive transcriptional regulator NikR [Telmatospirillum siberiense]
MERVSISLDDGLLEEFDSFIRRKGYENRSEAIRDLLRQRLEADREEKGDAEYAIGCLSYVYNHHQRELARRLTETQHSHHDLMLSTLHVHLDHENCLEVVLLRGATPAVRQFSEQTIAETGVRHGYLHLVATEMEHGRHSHRSSDEHHHADDHGHSHHVHLKPKT